MDALRAMLVFFLLAGTCSAVTAPGMVGATDTGTPTPVSPNKDGSNPYDYNKLYDRTPPTSFLEKKPSQIVLPKNGELSESTKYLMQQAHHKLEVQNEEKEKQNPFRASDDSRKRAKAYRNSMDGTSLTMLNLLSPKPLSFAGSSSAHSANPFSGQYVSQSAWLFPTPVESEDGKSSPSHSLLLSTSMANSLQPSAIFPVASGARTDAAGMAADRESLTGSKTSISSIISGGGAASPRPPQMNDTIEKWKKYYEDKQNKH